MPKRGLWRVTFAAKVEAAAKTRFTDENRKALNDEIHKHIESIVAEEAILLRNALVDSLREADLLEAAEHVAKLEWAPASQLASEVGAAEADKNPPR